MNKHNNYKKTNGGYYYQRNGNSWRRISQADYNQRSSTNTNQSVEINDKII
jgi:hypothetical protein